MRLAVVQVRDVRRGAGARRALPADLQECADRRADLTLFPEGAYLGGYVLDPALALKASQVTHALPRLQRRWTRFRRERRARAAVSARREALLNAVAMMRPRQERPRSWARRISSRQNGSGSRPTTGSGPARWRAGRPRYSTRKLGFPEVARVLALRGARLLLRAGRLRRGARASGAPPRSPRPGERLPATATRPRPGRRGELPGARPSSTRAVRSSPRPGTATRVVADLDAALVDEVRGGDSGGGGHTYFQDRRPALYGDICRLKAPDCEG